MEQLINKFIDLRRIKLFLIFIEPIAVCDIERKATDETYLYIINSIKLFLNSGLIEKQKKNGRKIYYNLTEKGKRIQELLVNMNALLIKEKSEGNIVET